MTTDVKIYRTLFKRLKGFMFRKRKIDYVICFPKCNSIHTFFMFQKIDVVMTDKNNRILKIYKSLKPMKVILPKKSIYYTYEFPENSTDCFKLGDIITLFN